MERGRGRGRGGRGGYRRRGGATAASSSSPVARASHGDAVDAGTNNSVAKSASNAALLAGAAADVAGAGDGVADAVSNYTTPTAATATVNVTSATPASPSAGRTSATGSSLRGGRSKTASTTPMHNPADSPPVRMTRSEKPARASALAFSTPSQAAATSADGGASARGGRRRSAMDMPAPPVDVLEDEALEGSRSKGGHALRKRARVDYSKPDLQAAIASAAAEAAKAEATTDPAISFSSRGRKRKMSALARAGSFGEMDPVTPTATKRPRLTNKAKETPAPRSVRRRGTAAGSGPGPAEVSPAHVKTEVMDEIEVAVNSPVPYDSSDGAEEDSDEEEPESSSEESAGVPSPSPSDNSPESPDSPSPVKSGRGRGGGRGGRRRGRGAARGSGRRAQAPGRDTSQAGIVGDRPGNSLIVRLYTNSVFLKSLLPASDPALESEKAEDETDELSTAPPEDLSEHDVRESESLSPAEPVLSPEPLSARVQIPQPPESTIVDEPDETLEDVHSGAPAPQPDSPEPSAEFTTAADATEVRDAASEDASRTGELKAVVDESSNKTEEPIKTSCGEPAAEQVDEKRDGPNLLDGLAELPTSVSPPRDPLFDSATETAPIEATAPLSQEQLSEEKSTSAAAPPEEVPTVLELRAKNSPVPQEPAGKSNNPSTEHLDPDPDPESPREHLQESADEAREHPVSSLPVVAGQESVEQVAAQAQHSEHQTSDRDAKGPPEESIEHAVPKETTGMQPMEVDASVIENPTRADEPTTEPMSKQEPAEKSVEGDEARQQSGVVEQPADVLLPTEESASGTVAEEMSDGLPSKELASDAMVIDRPVEETPRTSLVEVAKVVSEPGVEASTEDRAVEKSRFPETSEPEKVVAVVESRDQADRTYQPEATAASKQGNAPQEPPAARQKSKSPDNLEKLKDAQSQALDDGLTPTVESTLTPPQLIEDTAPTPTRTPTPSSSPIPSIYEGNHKMASDVDGAEPALRFAPVTPVDSTMPEPHSPQPQPKAAPATGKPSPATQDAVVEPSALPKTSAAPKPYSDRVLRKRPAVVQQEAEEENATDDFRPWTKLTPYVDGVTRYPEIQEPHPSTPSAAQTANEAPAVAAATESTSDESPSNDAQADIAKGGGQSLQKAVLEAEAASDAGRDGKFKQLSFKKIRSPDEFVDALAGYKTMNTADLISLCTTANASLCAWQNEYVGLRKIIDSEYNAPRRRADEPKEDERIARALERFKTQGVYDLDVPDSNTRQAPKGFQLRRTLDPRRWVMEIDKDGDQVKADARANDKVMAQAYGFEPRPRSRLF
ncbi:hypothetical protein MAPG_09458 [Magnaporthiopsis poae ATCC 64411]|uniref:Uncharacterized protein n=1 Tax=Magnaporthiopsis poae (strain ATCC 64411 / 73-15) TaxID=644358 RepID=A0A0C4EA05_MAGP6|nr:hypothetical protein MAPG_09458 [Magnaporthiopsis poae ATCC 64411]